MGWGAAIGAMMGSGGGSSMIPGLNEILGQHHHQSNRRDFAVAAHDARNHDVDMFNRTSAFNQKEAEKARQFNRNMRDTQYQAMVHDLKNAGLNPLIALGGAAASTGPAASAQGSGGVQQKVGSPQELMSSASDMIDGVRTFGKMREELKQMRQQTKNLKQTNRNLKVQELKGKADTALAKDLGKKARSDSARARQETRRSKLGEGMDQLMGNFGRNADKVAKKVGESSAKSFKSGLSSWKEWIKGKYQQWEADKQMQKNRELRNKMKGN
jgi:hypothetical protein